MDFLDLLENIRAEDASPQRLFNNEGVGLRALSRKRRDNPRYMTLLAEAATFVADIYKGKRPLYQFREALSTDDFPYLFGDILDRQLLGNYQESPYSWNLYARRRTVRDFREVRRYFLNGAEGSLPEVGELEQYKRASLDDGFYGYRVAKYGRRLPLSWEDIINDDLDAFRDIPLRFGRASRRTEEKLVTQLFVDASGPHASFYTVGNANLVTGNPALSVAALQTAMTTILTMKDADNEPIIVDMVTLVVPPQLKITALNILNTVQFELRQAGGTDEQRAYVGNWLSREGIVQVAVNFYIPQIAATANGATSWFLFAEPETSRPAMEVGFLRGHEAPEIFLKAPNTIAVGAASTDPLNGDFDTDSLEYKVRHVIGAARMDPKMTVASNGSGS